MILTITSLTEYTNSGKVPGRYVIVNGTTEDFPGAMVSIPVVADEGRALNIGMQMAVSAVAQPKT